MYRYNFDQRYALRLQGLYSRLEAYDSDSPDTPAAACGGWASAPCSFEASALAGDQLPEIQGTRPRTAHNWTPFVFAGLAYFHTNPQNQLDDTWYDLQPLGTEGQGTSGRRRCPTS